MTKTTITISTTIALLLASCASTGSKKTAYKNGGSYGSIEELIQQTDLDEETVSGGEEIRKSTAKHKIPRVINESVNKWIIYFTKDNPDWFQRALSRSEEFETDMKNILISSDVPEELFYLALIESAFVKRAGSRAGAKGIWQFMKGTAKLYGLQVKRGNDERYDPYKSTAAAAAYLKDLYNIYGSWYLAIASYNAGEGRIRNAILRHRERSFWELAAKNALPDETMNYVPKFIAAVIVAENYKKFGFAYNGPSSGATVVADDVNKLVALDQYHRGARPQRTSSSKGSSYASNTEEAYTVRRGDNLSRIAQKFGTTISELRECNDDIRGNKINVGQKLAVNCSGTKKETTPKAVVVARNTQQSNPTSMAKALGTYRVRYGDTLEGISKKYSLTVDQIKECNPTVQRYQILAGQSLKLTCAKEPAVAATELPTGYKVHIVRNGESLWSISNKYGVTIADLMRWNKLKKRSIIFKGRRLKIYNS